MVGGITLGKGGGKLEGLPCVKCRRKGGRGGRDGEASGSDFFLACAKEKN